MRKKIIIILIAVLTLVVIIGLWVWGYSSMRKNDQRIREEALFNIVCEYVQSDADFIAQYGAIDKIELSPNGNIVILDDKKCQVPCSIVTDNEQSYLVWVEYDFSGESDSFEYIDIKPLH